LNCKKNLRFTHSPDFAGMGKCTNNELEYLGPGKHCAKHLLEEFLTRDYHISTSLRWSFCPCRFRVPLFIYLLAARFILILKVRHLEPWERGTRKITGMTGMCGGYIFFKTSPITIKHIMISSEFVALARAEWFPLLFAYSINCSQFVSLANN
jgi:hypothetical protein